MYQRFLLSKIHERNEIIMSLLEITGLSHAFGDNQLYKNAGLSLNKGEHMGIVGQNGAGKSTLIKLCTEQVIPDQGRIIWQPGATLGCLDQYARIDARTTVKGFLKQAYSHFYEMEEQVNALYARAAQGDGIALERAARIQEQLEAHDFYSIDSRIERVALGLGLTALGLDRPIGQMSGGQRAKVILAKLLLEKPDVLLLDEPTNFLDKDHVAWLADYLSGLENAFMAVSHDTEFLNRIANRICHIDNGSMTKYSGSYREFLEKKALLRRDYVRQYSAQQKEIKKTEEFIRKNIAGRKSKMARGRQKQLNRLDRMEALEEREIKPVFRFTPLPLTDTEHLRVSHLSVGYGRAVLSDIDFSIQGGEKVVVTGFNGIGKSTFLKTLVKQLPVLEGGFSFSHQVAVGYFEQDLAWEDQGMTPVGIVADAFPSMRAKEVRKSLARCGVSSRHQVQPVGTLSGGEQGKVRLCLLTMHPCNFLILDEPDNHLDLQAKKALGTALEAFPGTVLLVSHEEAFYRNLAQRVVDLGGDEGSDGLKENL